MSKDTTSNPANDALTEGAMPDGHVPYREEIDRMTTETRTAYSVWRTNKSYILGVKDIHNREAILELWDAFGDIPVDDNQCIEVPFLHFGEGTALIDVWHWFEEELDYPVHMLQKNRLVSPSSIEEYSDADNEMKDAIGKYIEISTGHITLEDVEILRRHHMTWDHDPGFDTNCNWFEGLAELEHELNVSSECLDIMMWGYRNDLTFIRFHPDGPFFAGLPVFDW